MASGTPAKAILSKLVINLYEKRKCSPVTCIEPGSKVGAKELKTELNGYKREIKAEYKSFLREIKAVRKTEKNALKEEKKVRRAERKNARKTHKKSVAGRQVGNSDSGSWPQKYN